MKNVRQAIMDGQPFGIPVKTLWKNMVMVKMDEIFKIKSFLGWTKTFYSYTFLQFC